VLGQRWLHPLYDSTYLGQDDAFDGGFMLEFGGTDFKDPDDLATREGNTINLGGAADADGLKVSAVARAIQTSPTLQYLVKLRNPSGTGITSTVRLSTDLGSDSGTTILQDSSGNSVHGDNDRWLVSADAATAPFDDPIVTQAYRGKNAKAASTVSDPLASADECLGVDFTVKVPAGATRYMLFFAQLHDNSGAGKNAAFKDAGAFNGQKSMAGVLKGISPKIYSKIVNWNLKK